MDLTVNATDSLDLYAHVPSLSANNFQVNHIISTKQYHVVTDAWPPKASIVLVANGLVNARPLAK